MQYSSFQSEDEIEEELPVEIPLRDVSFYIDPATMRVVIMG